jgi:hypothetical protein
MRPICDWPMVKVKSQTYSDLKTHIVYLYFSELDIYYRYILDIINKGVHNTTVCIIILVTAIFERIHPFVIRLYTRVPNMRTLLHNDAI